MRAKFIDVFLVSLRDTTPCVRIIVSFVSATKYTLFTTCHASGKQIAVAFCALLLGASYADHVDAGETTTIVRARATSGYRSIIRHVYTTTRNPMYPCKEKKKNDNIVISTHTYLRRSDCAWREDSRRVMRYSNFPCNTIKKKTYTRGETEPEPRSQTPSRRTNDEEEVGREKKNPLRRFRPDTKGIWQRHERTRDHFWLLFLL